MSRRATLKTAITDKDLAIKLLQQMGVAHEVQGDVIHAYTGRSAEDVQTWLTQRTPGFELDLKTGNVTEERWFGEAPNETVLLLRQYYNEAQHLAGCLKNGITIDERQVNANDDIILMWHGLA